jgi:uncharacterized membrane protein
LLLHVRERSAPRAIAPAIRLAVELFAVALTLLTGHLGGLVSGVNGPG